MGQNEKTRKRKHKLPLRDTTSEETITSYNKTDPSCKPSICGQQSLPICILLSDFICLMTLPLLISVSPSALDGNNTAVVYYIRQMLTSEV